MTIRFVIELRLIIIILLYGSSSIFCAHRNKSDAQTATSKNSFWTDSNVKQHLIAMQTNKHSSIIHINNLPRINLRRSNNSLKSLAESDSDYLDFDSSEIESDSNKTASKVYFWGKWSKWSKCSALCGGGVQIKKRKCVEKDSSNSPPQLLEFDPLESGTHKGCVGLYKRYRICNHKACHNISSQTDRTQQCSSYNNVSFHGSSYEWEPYVKETNECELNCKPKGQMHFATLNSSVINGTPCTRPAVYFEKHFRGRAVCVEGICKAVHSSGAMRGDTTGDSLVRCGSVLCDPVSRTFTKAHLPHGYFHITTIPVGAANITIYELEYSENLLVLKSENDFFIINGDHEPSKSGTYKFHDNVFEYESGEENESLEKITTEGFLSKAVDLLVLVKDTNPGIHYSYFIPVSSNSIADEVEEDMQWNELGVPLDYGTERQLTNGDESNAVDTTTTTNHVPQKKKRKFEWRLVGFGHCSKSCGGGYRSPIFRCTRDVPTRFYSPRRCKHIQKPVFNELIFRCNTQDCPGYWRLERWDECLCNNGQGFRERVVKCVRELATGAVTQVDESLCLDEKPTAEEECECPKPVRRRVSRHRTDRPRVYYHSHGTESVIVLNKTTVSNTVNRAKHDKSGVWLMSPWNKHCSADCGTGVEYRSIFCDRTYPYVDRCEFSTTPDTSRPCIGENKCKMGIWFTGQWGECNGDCFNLFRKRDVLCVREGLIVNDEECTPEKKPEESENCTISQVQYCKAKWHYSQWTECSKTCGGGTQRRFVRCLEVDKHENVLKESKNCRYLEREPVYSSCNTQDCPETIVDTKVSRIQNDVDATCQDELSNCHLVNKDRLCGLNYYQHHCCYTCNL